jgi:hypothetical protein
VDGCDCGLTEWAYMLYGNARITAVDSQGGDLW